MPVILGLDTASPYVPLDSHPEYALTLPSLQDADATCRYLSQNSIARNLSSCPEPYTIKDAEWWISNQLEKMGYEVPATSSKDGEGEQDISTRTRDSDSTRYTAIPKTTEPTTTTNNREHKFAHLASLDEDTRKKFLASSWPFTQLRHMPSGDIVGSVALRRNSWEWMATLDPISQVKIYEENERKPVGNNEIIYSIGYWLAPEMQRKGLMSAAVNTLLEYANDYMNAKYIQGVCRKDNPASRRVLGRSGFVYKQEAEMPWKGNNAIVEVFDLESKS